MPKKLTQIKDTLTPRRFFYVTDDEDARFRVEVTKTLTTLEAATAHAASIARKLAADDFWQGFVVAVTDVRGNEIARIPIHPRWKGMRGRPRAKRATRGRS
jgi:hypothetical protein